MIINWYGQNCFRINVQTAKDQAVNILVDPPDKESGLRSPKMEADILLVDSGGAAASGNYFLITGPGEYEIKGVYIEGIPSSKNTIYTIRAEEIKICHLGKFNQDELTPDQLERIGDIDILMIPVGARETIDSRKAVKIMSQIEPKIIIPMNYKIPKMKIKLDPVDNFLKSLGIKSLPALPKLSIKKKDISAEEAKIVVLEP